MRILVVGQGGREHAILMALSRSKERPELIAYMNSLNPAIAALCTKTQIGSMKTPDAIADFAWQNRVDLAIVGPEEPLVHGAADALHRKGIPTVGPRQELARMEGDKTFLRDVVARWAPQANPGFAVCHSAEDVHKALVELGDVAVKPLGLTGGKGVRVMGTQLETAVEAEAYAMELILLQGKVLLEEKLLGEEFSQIVFTDGVRMVPMPLVQDAKCAYEGDTGPMTGGMGTFTLPDHKLPFIPDDQLQQARTLLFQIIMGAQEQTGQRYHGILYGQFMATRNGPRIVETNVRLGDPEAINLMALLKSDPVETFVGTTCGLPDLVEFSALASVAKYLVPQTYPDKSERGQPVTVDLELLKKEQMEFVVAGAEMQAGRYIPTGSRFAAVLALRPDLVEAEAAVENILAQMDLTGLRHRTDIAKAGSLQKKIERMQVLLS